MFAPSRVMMADVGGSPPANAPPSKEEKPSDDLPGDSCNDDVKSDVN